MAKLKEYTVGDYAKLRNVTRQTVHIWILKKRDGAGKPLRFKKIGTQYIILSEEKFNEQQEERVPADGELPD